MRRPYVVASIPIKSYSDIQTALSITDADFVELRLDYFDNPMQIDYTGFIGKRIILTLRDIDEGGKKRFDPEIKKHLIKLWHGNGLMYDVELSFVERYGVEYENAIVSIHILNPTQALVDHVLAKVSRYVDKAFAVKVAVTPFKGYKKFLASLLELGDNIAVMPISSNAVERIGFALLGSKLVYGYVTEPTAPGQLHYKKLISILNTIYTSSITT